MMPTRHDHQPVRASTASVAGRAGRLPVAALMVVPLFMLTGCSDAALDAPVRLKSPTGRSAPTSSSTVDSTAGAATQGIELATAGIEARDLCAVFASLSQLRMPETAQARQRLMMLVHDVMKRSEQFADSGIQEDWNVLLQAIGDEVATERSKSADRDDQPSVASERFIVAQRHLEAWVDANCG